MLDQGPSPTADLWILAQHHWQPGLFLSVLTCKTEVLKAIWESNKPLTLCWDLICFLPVFLSTTKGSLSIPSKPKTFAV